MTPFWANYHFHPEMQFKRPKAPTIALSEVKADVLLAGLEETHEILRQSLLEAQTRQSMYAGGKDMIFKVGANVWLSTRNIRTTRPCEKLDDTRAGPYMVSKIINNAYKLDLQKTMRIHDVFHVSLLDQYSPPIMGQPSSEPERTIVDNSGYEWEVERILDTKPRYRKLSYLVQWAGYNYVRTSWEPAENLENAQELVNKFHQTHLGMQRR